jgi:hypothetical protein
MKKILALVSIAFAFSACKKDTTAPVPSEIVSSPHTVSTASVYSGAFVAGNYTIIASAGTVTSSDARASFYSPPKANKTIGPGIEVESLKLNENLVMYDHAYNYYLQRDWSLDKEQVWQVEGKESITSFNFRLNNPTPSCTDLNVIPDSVNLHEGFTLHIPGVTNVTPGARVIIYNGNYTEVASKPIANGDNSISFSASDFAFFGTQGFVLIELENSQAYNFYGQDFIFVKAKGLMKQVKFKS